jgi:hypothetical protein
MPVLWQFVCPGDREYRVRHRELRFWIIIMPHFGDLLSRFRGQSAGRPKFILLDRSRRPDIREESSLGF